MIVRGRVTDAEGRAVAGARVALDLDFATVPAIGQKGAAWRDAPLTATTDAAGGYAFDVPPENRGPFRQHDRALLALHGDRVSQRVVIEWADAEVGAPDLVLEPGVVGRVRVVWEDGSRVPDASVDVMLDEQTPEGGDPRSGLHWFEGTADGQGELSFGPVRDLEYRRIAVKVVHPDAPVQHPWWDGQRVPAADAIEVSLFRGRTVRGRLLTPDGRAAAGYRVAPWSPEGGDPATKRVVTAGADGGFEVRGVASEDGAIAVYESVPRPDSGNLPARVRAAMDGARISGYPLLILDVPPGQDDLGAVPIPALGTLIARLEDASGAPVRSGSAWWTRARRRHGGVGCRLDPHGVLRFQRVPLGIEIVLHLTFDDPRHGELRQAFRIPDVREETIALRATGAGTVIFRLHPMGAPDRPLTVSYVSFGEHECHGAARDGPLSELRWWTWPAFYPSLQVEAKGFRKRVVENVTVRDDGPTFLDVELEPR